MTQHDGEVDVESQNVTSYAQPKMQMIQEDGDGNTALSSAQIANKPFSAAHQTRKRTRDGQSDQRYGAMSKQSTQFTGGAGGMNRGVVGMSGGFSGQYDNQKPPRQYLSSIPGMTGSK